MSVTDQVGLVETVERVLINLYSNRDTLERLVGNAQLDISKFNFDGDYRSALNRCLRQANDLGSMGDIIAAAKRDYPQNDALKRLADQLELERPIAAQIATLAAELRGFLLLLRRSRHLTRREFNELEAVLLRTLDLTKMAESDPRQGDNASDQWYDLDQNLRLCLRQFQLYKELVDASVESTRRRLPGASVEHVPLAELAADKSTLIDAKLQLFDSLTAAVQSYPGTA
jgi:hypothetical protein